MDARPDATVKRYDCAGSAASCDKVMAAEPAATVPRRPIPRACHRSSSSERAPASKPNATVRGTLDVQLSR